MSATRGRPLVCVASSRSETSDAVPASGPRTCPTVVPRVTSPDNVRAAKSVAVSGFVSDPASNIPVVASASPARHIVVPSSVATATGPLGGWTSTSRCSATWPWCIPSSITETTPSRHRPPSRLRNRTRSPAERPSLAEQRCLVPAVAHPAPAASSSSSPARPPGQRSHRRVRCTTVVLVHDQHPPSRVPF